MTQSILHIPHSSSIIPFYDGYLASEKEIENEILKLTDWHTQDLFSHPSAIPIITPFSRVFCDVERFHNDEDEEMAKYGMGMTYTRLDNGKDLRSVNKELNAKIYKDYYKPHHEKITVEVDKQLQTNGKALIIDCHSFSEIPFERDLNQTRPRPQICIGTDDFHTPKHLINFSQEYFKNKGYNCKTNNPYKGTLVPLKHYKKTPQVQSIMIELNRNLYLKDNSNQKNKDYQQLKDDICEFLDKLHISASISYNKNVLEI